MAGTRHTLLALFGAILGALCTTGADAQESRERQLKLAFLPTDQHPIGLGAQRFAELVAAKSGGRIRIRPFSGGALGGDLPVISALQGGTIEMTVVVTSNLAGIARDFSLLDSPFLFNDEREADAILDGPVGERLLAELPAKGLIGLGYFEFGFRHFLNSRRPIETVADIQGLKIRVTQAPVYIDFITSLGANATPLGIPELYTALEQRAVDGMDAPLSFIRLQRYDEVQKYLALSRHVYNAQIILMSKRVWDRLPEDERRVLSEAAREARAYQRQVSREQDAAELQRLRTTMQTTELPAQEMAKMRERAQTVTNRYFGTLNPDLVQTFKAELERVRAAR